MINRQLVLVIAVLVASLSAAWCRADGPAVSTTDDSWPASLEPLRLSVEQAVTRGVVHLAGLQKADGSLTDHWGNVTAIVGLTGKAFLAAGVTPDDPVHGETLVKLITFIVDSQREDGLLWREGAENITGHALMYAHGIATGFLAECSGLVDEPLQERVHQALTKALALILRAQGAGGGWRYSVTPSGEDLSVSGWSLLALRAARINGAAVPEEAIARAVRYVQACRGVNGGFHYMPSRGPTGGSTMTGVGLLCMMLTGGHDDPLNASAGDIILASTQPDGRVIPGGGANVAGKGEYTLYHCTLAMYQLGGDHWERYAERVIPGMVARQGPQGNWGDVYTTAIHVICLCAPFSQSPMLQR